MKHAMAYIQQHYREKLTLEDVARQVNLSPFHFSRVFKQYAGCAPMEYAQKIRMDMAKCLLKTTDLPIEQIAERVGYGSSSSFANMFTQKVGLSPTQFRKFPICKEEPPLSCAKAALRREYAENRKGGMNQP